MLKTPHQIYRNWADHSIYSGLASRYLKQRLLRTLYQKDRLANVAMLHAGRCGSSVLADLINQHPDFRWAGELFENMLPVYYKMPAKNRAQHLISNNIYAHNTKYYGFDSKYLPEQHLRYELANKSIDEYIQLLNQIGFNHYILLSRKNHLRRAVSVAIGTQTNQWSTKSQPKVNKPIYIDPNNFVSYGKQMSLFQYFENLDNTHQKVRQLTKNNRVLELEYEEHIEKDPIAAYKKVCNFLAIESAQVSIRLNKQNPKKLNELIENYEEIHLLFTNSKYEWMLDA